MNDLTNPVGVFDAGIGSLSIVKVLQDCHPKQDVVWLADRESFPLGEKSPDELFEIGKKNIDRLAQEGVKSIIVAANVLSMVVLSRLQEAYPSLELFGVLPPVEQAAVHGDFCVMGVKSMVEDPSLARYIERQNTAQSTAHTVNASSLIDDLVETGVFITDPNRAQQQVTTFVSAIPDVKSYTLSSTHLPWLREFFEHAAQDKVFIDPAELLISTMPLPNNGNGRVLALTTENKVLGMTLGHLKSVLDLVGYPNLEPRVV